MDEGTLFDSGRMFYGRLPRAIIGGTLVLLAGSLLTVSANGALPPDPLGGAVLIGCVAVVTGIIAFGLSRIRVLESDVRLLWFPFYRRRIPLRRSAGQLRRPWRLPASTFTTLEALAPG